MGEGQEGRKASSGGVGRLSGHQVGSTGASRFFFLLSGTQRQKSLFSSLVWEMTDRKLDTVYLPDTQNSAISYLVILLNPLRVICVCVC